MGFQSSVADYVEQRRSLDKHIITRPSSTYLMPAAETIWRTGIIKDTILVVGGAAFLVDG